MFKVALAVVVVVMLTAVHGLGGTHPAVTVRFEGYLQDASGQGIDGAAVTLRMVNSGHELANFQSKNGAFRLWYESGETGPYELLFEAPGFESQRVAWPPSNWPHVIVLVAKSP